MYCARYSFASGGTDKIPVSPGLLYAQKLGYGFVTEKNRRQQALLRIPELNSGFEPAPWFCDSDLTDIGQDEAGCFGQGVYMPQESRRIPLCFKAGVPKGGRYKVTLLLYSREDMRDIRVFSGRRRLEMAQPFLKAGTPLECRMWVDVSDIIPRGHTEVFADTAVDLAVVADRPCIASVAIEEALCPAVILAGDSTVTDQTAQYPFSPMDSYAGWGQMLSFFFGEGVAVSNHSHSGLTTESFRQEGHYEVIRRFWKRGDYILFQFGHNDQKLSHLQAEGGYRENLARYIEEARAAGLHPLLVTPLSRNTWKGSDGSYNDLLEAYAESCLRLGREMEVPVLDLHGQSMAFLKEKGKEAAKPYFFPGDYTHTNDCGACLMAWKVACQIREVCGGDRRAAYRDLAAYVQTELPEDLCRPEPVTALEKPEGYVQEVMQQGSRDLLEDLTDPEGVLLRAEGLDMVVRSAGFFQTNVYNDLFTDVVGHEWYAGIVECALQNGILIPEVCRGKLFCPQEPVTLLDFLVFAMNAYSSRKELPGAADCPYDGQSPDWAKKAVRAAWALGALDADGKDRLASGISRRRGAQICRDIKILG